MTTRLAIAACVVALAACSGPTTLGDAANVGVVMGANTQSRCVQVVLTAGTQTRRTGPMVVTDGRERYVVGVLRSDLPAAVTAEAVGFSDEGCLTPTSPPESSGARELTFLPTEIVRLTLEVEVQAPATEAGLCANAADDDLDGLTDCADPDCNGAGCSPGDLCTTGATCASGRCTGGTPVACATPPACFTGLGVCVPGDGGCSYTPDPGATCDDANPCTDLDRCDLSGACAGTPKTCNAPPAQCYAALGTCVADGGCEYGFAPGASCSDFDTCTTGDQCDALGGCAGTTVSCPATSCAGFAGSCQSDGGCSYAPFDAGTACDDGGVCNAFGGCVPAFPYPPSNFTVAQVPTLPTGATVLDCGETVIDTGSSGAPTATNWCTGQPLFGWGTVPQAGGPPAVILSFASLEVKADAGLRFTGDRPAIVAVGGRFTVLGTVSTEAGAQRCTGSGVGGNGGAAASNGGAGGGGFGTVGSSGGAGGYAGSGGAGGVVGGNEVLVPLRGGCPGGLGGSSNARVSRGGGALQVSAAGDVTVLGNLLAPGEAGAGGAGDILGKGAGGNGAGSGGAILLEGLTVTMVANAVVAANGGGGGEGGSIAGGNDGEAPTASETAAAGGTGGNVFGGGGGAGAAGTTGAVGAGNASVATAAAGGGGGGGVGRIRVNVALNCSVGPSVLFSPPATSNRPDAGCP